MEEIGLSVFMGHMEMVQTLNGELIWVSLHTLQVDNGGFTGKESIIINQIRLTTFPNNKAIQHFIPA